MKNKIYLVQFPLEGRKGKIRPVLCLNEPIGEYDLVTLAYIGTNSNIDELNEFDVLLNRDDNHFPASGLKADSVI